MNKSKLQFLSFICFLNCGVLMSFQEPNFEEKIIGVWVPFETDRGPIYRKVEKFLFDNPGIEFKADGKYICKVNDETGRGNPKPVYNKYEGTWQMCDSTIRIYRNFRGGSLKETYELVNVDSSKLILRLYGSIIVNDTLPHIGIEKQKD